MIHIGVDYPGSVFLINSGFKKIPHVSFGQVRFDIMDKTRSSVLRLQIISIQFFSFYEVGIAVYHHYIMGRNVDTNKALLKINY